MDEKTAAESQAAEPKKGVFTSGPNLANIVPPEKPAAIWTRRLILLSFWAVVVCLGLPHWIWTTSIYRSELPLDLMSEWDGGKTCQFQYPLHIRIDATELDTRSQTELVARTQDQLRGLPNFQLYDFHVTAGTYKGSQSALSDWDGVLTVRVEETPLNQPPESTLRSWDPVLDVTHATGQSIETLASLLTTEIHDVFKGELESISYLLGKTPFASGKEVQLRPESKAILDARTTRAFKYASTYHLTFSLFTSSAAPSAWDIEAALQQYITPLLSPFSRISQFKIDTQVQLHASFSPSISGPQFDEDTNSWRLQKSDLSGFINAAEWPLSPSIGTGPTINFVLYIPSPEQSPLVIAETGGSSWLIPQWGGVQILSLPQSNDTAKQQRLTAADLEPVMLTFADQLTSLLGLPPSPPSLALRISSLTRERAISLILSASSTLGALSRLTLKLTSIAIPDTVAKSVASTLEHLELACQNLRSGDFDAALANARTAEAEVEQAFFEPSMVGQVYFPDEHKVAVYVPLLGPMAVPLIMAAVKEIKEWRAKGKGKSS